VRINVIVYKSRKQKSTRFFSYERGYEGFWNFEAFWQSGKVFEGIPEEKVKKFWHKVSKIKRHYPGSKGKKVLYAHFEYNTVKIMKVGPL